MSGAEQGAGARCSRVAQGYTGRQGDAPGVRQETMVARPFVWVRPVAITDPSYHPLSILSPYDANVRVLRSNAWVRITDPDPVLDQVT